MTNYDEMMTPRMERCAGQLVSEGMTWQAATQLLYDAVWRNVWMAMDALGVPTHVDYVRLFLGGPIDRHDLVCRVIEERLAAGEQIADDYTMSIIEAMIENRGAE